MAKRMICGGKEYQVSDDAKCVDGKVTGASAKTYIGKYETIADKTGFGAKGRKAADSAEKSYAEKGMEIVRSTFGGLFNASD